MFGKYFLNKYLYNEKQDTCSHPSDLFSEAVSLAPTQGNGGCSWLYAGMYTIDGWAPTREIRTMEMRKSFFNKLSLLFQAPRSQFRRIFCFKIC